MKVGVEGLGLFETCMVAGIDGTCPNHPEYPKGAVLRDAALAKAASGRQEAIQRVRDRLLWLRNHGTGIEDDRDGERFTIVRILQDTVTADDVHDALDALGLGDGDTRWSANILRGWNLVSPTEKFVPSRRPSRHCAPTRVWRWA